MAEQNGQAVQTQQQTQAVAKVAKMDALKKFIASDSIQQQLATALGETGSSFAASIIDLYANDSYLQNCQPAAVVMEAMKAAVLKLPVIKGLGFAFIIPYKKDGLLVPQFQLGYKGLIQLALRTGQYKHINCDMVYEGELRYKNKLTGEFDFDGEPKSEKIVGYFAHFELLNGFSKTLHMTKERVIAHAQKYSKSYKTESSPWKTEFDAMAKKTVLRGLFSHWGYLSVEMQDALTEDDKDVAEKVLSDIAEHGNKRNMSFENVEEADVTGNGFDGNANEGPGF
jgi:recombination protein RecT